MAQFGVAAGVSRLRETQFVAVVGGSGCGKSSLIRAGLIPALRDFGIPEAGDYWVPIVMTPGTISQRIGRGKESVDVPHQTAVTRLAWKFNQALTPCQKKVGPAMIESVDCWEKADQESRRRSKIATAFRQPAGFSILVDSFSEDLPECGPSKDAARFVFVIDQFEELFHPNNARSDDAKILIEAVIDHFICPNPRCYLVITIRSEHLADCATYLELPDAINKSRCQ